MIRPRSLTGRLVITAVALVAVVSVLIGAVAALATRSYLIGQLDDDVRATLMRAENAPSRRPGRRRRCPTPTRTTRRPSTGPTTTSVARESGR